jgi:hypothetical protein
MAELRSVSRTLEAAIPARSNTSVEFAFEFSILSLFSIRKLAANYRCWLAY